MKKISDLIFNKEFCKSALTIIAIANLLIEIRRYTIYLFGAITIWSLLVILYDMFTKKLVFKNKYRLILLLFLVSYAVTLIVNREWFRLQPPWIIPFLTVVQLFLLYSYDPDTDKETVLRQIKRYLAVVILAGLFCSFLSLYLYYFPVSGFNMISSDRFRGIYQNVNNGACIAMISFLASIGYLFILKAEKKFSIMLLFVIINPFFQLIYLYYADTRAVFVALPVGLFVFVYYFWFKIFKGRNKRAGWIITAAVLIAFAGLCVICHSEIIDFFQRLIHTFYNAPETPSTVTRDYGSGRFTVWKNGLNIWSEQPVFGISHFNIPERVVLLQELNAAHMHNIFLQVLVSNGIVGLACFLVVTGLFVKDLVWYFWARERSPDPYYTVMCCLMALVIAIFTQNMFEVSLLLSSNAAGVIFWTALGYMMYYIEKQRAEFGTKAAKRRMRKQKLNTQFYNRMK